MITYDNKEITFTGCPGCAYFNHEFELSCGMAFQNDNFSISQDWELPISGMMIISPKRHINELCELDENERNELFYLTNKTIKILKENNIAETFMVSFEERKNVHFHVCIIPKHNWMTKITPCIADEFAKVIDYAKETFLTEQNFAEIKRVSDIVYKNLHL